MIFDLRRVHFMDMGALRILMGAKSHVAGAAAVHVLVDEDLPKRVIYMARLQSAMKVCHSIDEALADIALRATHAPHLQVTAPRPGLMSGARHPLPQSATYLLVSRPRSPRSVGR